MCELVQRRCQIRKVVNRPVEIWCKTQKLSQGYCIFWNRPVLHSLNVLPIWHNSIGRKYVKKIRHLRDINVALLTSLVWAVHMVNDETLWDVSYELMYHRSGILLYWKTERDLVLVLDKMLFCTGHCGVLAFTNINSADEVGLVLHQQEEEGKHPSLSYCSAPCSQYTSWDYLTLLAQTQLEPSMACCFPQWYPALVYRQSVSILLLHIELECDKVANVPEVLVLECNDEQLR